MRRNEWLRSRDQRIHRAMRRRAGVRRHHLAVHRQRRLPPPDHLVAPAEFALYGSRHASTASTRAFCEFIRRIRDFRGRRLSIDMSGVQRMRSGGTLLFMAELSHQAARGCVLDGIAPRKMRVQQVVRQTGLEKLLRFNLQITVDREDVVHWRCVSGPYDRVESEVIGGMLVDAQASMEEPLYRGTIESVANCVEHAYKDHPDRRLMVAGQDGWWVFRQIRDGYMTMCVCDLGIGVANALPLKLKDEPDLLKRLLYVFRRLKGRDRRAMLAALEYGRTATKSTHRGRGMRDVMRVIDEAGSGSFMWLSRRGFFQYSRDGADREPKQKTGRLDDSIYGTICMWRFPIAPEAGHPANTLEPSWSTSA